MHQDNHGYLCMIIQPALKEDAGWYTVSAKNEAGIVSSTARLDVHCEYWALCLNVCVRACARAKQVIMYILSDVLYSSCATCLLKTTIMLQFPICAQFINYPYMLCSKHLVSLTVNV